MMQTSEQLPAVNAIRLLLASACPGDSEAVTQMREQILDFCSSPMARVVYLAGPSGSGKSTLARLIAFLKAYGLVNEKHLDLLMPENIPYSGPNLIDARMMAGWFVELPLTGLHESIADMQLFGAVRGAYTDARDRPGVFEQAAGDEKNPAVRMTGGVVFLDEVGELSPKLQTKLLPVLSNGVFYRVGGEGSLKHQVQYRGVVITASWRDIDSVLRADLVARLTTHVIDVPGLDERKEDLPTIVQSLATDSRKRFSQELERLMQADPMVSQTGLRHLAEQIGSVDEECAAKLSGVDWAAYGQLRGLANAVDKIVVQGRQPDDVLAALREVRERTPTLSLADILLTADGALGSVTLADTVRDLEARARKELRRRVSREDGLRQQLCEHFGLSENDLRKQIANLARDRRSR